MTGIISRRLMAAAVFAVALSLTAGQALAAKCDCGQPQSNGTKPNTTDCLSILKTAVGSDECGGCDPCVCDVDSSGGTNATDALRCLNVAVSRPGVTVNCNCGPGGPGCTSAEFTSLAGSDLDSGWTGVGHNQDLIVGASITFGVLRRCSDNQTVCETDDDCGNDDCRPTCDCQDDPLCEATGPTHQKVCLTTLDPCDSDDDCSVGTCIHTFGPPLPLSTGNTAVCVVTIFASDLTGTANSETGESVAAVSLRSRVHLGVNVNQPCPRCGAPNQNPEVGDTFTCVGGSENGDPCTVEATSVDFGGVSSDCPPDPGSNISGAGLSIRFDRVTTGEVSKTAQLPCTSPSFAFHPSLGNAFCIDNGSACSTNADCKRCSNNVETACTSNAQCGGGTCLAAPEQPITCGRYCHCGFCTVNNVNDVDRPCFDDTDCEDGGGTCRPGTGSGTQPNASQLAPNQCNDDGNICGLETPGLCANTFQGTCSLLDFRACQTDGDCSGINGGTCQFDFKPCFGEVISREGLPSPLGKYCASDPDKDTQCSTNGDCADGDECVEDSARPTAAALFCIPATSSSAVNSAAGTPGPGAVQLKTFVKTCFCGDGDQGCDEECDDGDNDSGDGCSEECRDE